MTSRTSYALTATMLATFFACAVGAILLMSANGEAGGRGLISIMIATAFFPIVGAVITARQPENRIGWLFAAIGLLWASGALAVEYSVYGYVTDPGSVPAPWLGAWYGEWNWVVFWLLALVATPMLFPTGRALSPRWGQAFRFILTVAGVLLVLTMLDPNLEIEGAGKDVPNPLGTSFGSDPDEETFPTALLIPLMLASTIVAAVSLVLRFRRSRGVERQQMKWFTFGATMLAVAFLGLAALDAIFGIKADVVAMALALVPVGAGIGILRYRLYDIDVIINRTLVYGALTALLAAIYLGVVFVLQGIVAGLGADSDLVVAASTLAVAALFSPLRRRVQAFIDHYFYRGKYDAAQTLTEFSARLRQEVDLDQLTSELVGVVRHTMQPAHLSLWLRTTARSAR